MPKIPIIPLSFSIVAFLQPPNPWFHDQISDPSVGLPVWSGDCTFGAGAAPVPVLTWRYDLTHAGQNTKETALTPANVNTSSFGKLFTLPVDSSVYAQPLYMPNLKMSDGLAHTILFVATKNDSVYAFDADSNGGRECESDLARTSVSRCLARALRLLPLLPRVP